MATIRDVGARAGVSPATVSNTLNGHGQVAETTKRKVMDAVRELGYKANIHAQQLVTQRSRILAIKLPDLKDMGAAGIPNSSYFLNLVNGAMEVANDRDYALVVLPSRADPQSLTRFGIDGYIVVDPGDESILSEDSPTVTIGGTRSGSVGQIDNDHATGLLIAMEEFARRNSRTSALLKDGTRRPYVESIASAYLAWSTQRNVASNVFELQTLEPSDIDALLRTMKELGVDSVYTTSDDLAVALLKRAQEMGVIVPDELAIISAVDGVSLTLTSPAISAMELFPLKAGELATTLLVNLLENGEVTETSIAVPIDYIQRGTS